MVAFGDFDYDTPQLFFRGDASVPDFAQKLLADGISLSPVPSDFPCDLCNPIYEIMEFLLKNCKAEDIPYSWLLQYLRLQNCKKCNLYKLVPKCCEKKNKKCNKCENKCENKCGNKCESKCESKCGNKCDQDFKEKGNCFDTSNRYNGNNRAQLRNMKQKGDRKDSFKDEDNFNDSRTKTSDKKGGCGCGSKSNNNNNKNNKNNNDNNCGFKSDGYGSKYANESCNKPACVAAKLCCCKPVCEVVCKDDCPINYRNCNCDDSKCEIRCRKNVECECDDSKHKVKVNTCLDLCKKKGKSCCGSCKKGGKCEGEVNICKNPCDDYKYCDTLSVLKRELCLFNALTRIPDVNDRYTGFYNHFNRCLDCKYPRGMFQAWAMCQDYDRPKKSRVIDNNSELMALDHFLISDCLKNNVTCACLSPLCMEKCGHDVQELLTDHCKMNAAVSYPYDVDRIFGTTMNIENRDFVFQYGGTIVRSFFTHRVYTVDFSFPHVSKGCKVDCDETLHGLGLTGLWSVLCLAGCGELSIRIFENFGLDKHPYFRDFFWDNLRRQKFPLGADAPMQNILLAHSSCVNESIISLQRRCSITEEEFYKHLLCVLTHVDSRDRFILTIAFMDAIYRVDRMRSIVHRSLVNAISNQCTIDNLFVLLSMCFKERLEVAAFLDNTKPFCDKTNYIAKVLREVDTKAVAELIDGLSSLLAENCLFMEVLIRNAVCIIRMATDANCNTGACNVALESLTHGPGDLSPVIKKVNCGYDIKQTLISYLDSISGSKGVAILFFLLTGIDITHHHRHD